MKSEEHIDEGEFDYEEDTCMFSEMDEPREQMEVIEIDEMEDAANCRMHFSFKAIEQSSN